MSETNKDALANISALFDLDKARFRSLTIDVREARRRADDLLAKITDLREAFFAAELQKQEELASEEPENAVVEETAPVAPEATTDAPAIPEADEQPEE